MALRMVLSYAVAPLWAPHTASGTLGHAMACCATNASQLAALAAASSPAPPTPAQQHQQQRCTSSGSPGAGGASQQQAAGGPATGGKPMTRMETARATGAGAAAMAVASTSGSAAAPSSFVASQQAAFAAMPLYPKMLGFAGAIPFVTLSPSFVEAAGFTHLADQAAQAQLMYAGTIVTFLGAVHWGLAMGTTLTAGAKATAALNERYMWSVVPSLAAVPALLMQPAQGSLCMSILLGICYLSDRSYFRTGVLPGWYITLRSYLTALATLGMLATTSYYLKKDVAKAKARMAEDDARRAARLAEAAPALVAAPAIAPSRK